MTFVTGNKSTFDNNGADVILDLKDGLDFLNQEQDGIGLLKKIGTNGFTFANHKYEWSETSLATRRETITLADGTATNLAVADAYQYQVNNLLKCEAEVMRVTAIADATHLTVVRAYAGTTGAAHAAKTMFSLGSADPEGSDAPAGLSDNGVRLFNYDQTLTRAVSLSKDEIAKLSTEGNPLTGQIKRRFIEINRELFQAVLYGVRYSDSSNEIYAMGGLTQFVTTNVTNVGGPLSIALIDAKILAIVQAGGGKGLVMAMGPVQKQKLDALDANKQMLGKREHTGGNLVTQTWQSGVLDHDIPVYVDHTILDDQVWFLDLDHIDIGTKSHNGVEGAFHVEDSTKKGADREDRVIRGKYTVRVGLEKALGYLYGLT
jgi:hypothetical protein